MSPHLDRFAGHLHTLAQEGKGKRGKEGGGERVGGRGGRRTATVSTLVTVVGQPHRPTLAGKGGLRRGLPCRSKPSGARSQVGRARPRVRPAVGGVGPAGPMGEDRLGEDVTGGPGEAASGTPRRWTGRADGGTGRIRVTRHLGLERASLSLCAGQARARSRWAPACRSWVRAWQACRSARLATWPRAASLVLLLLGLERHPLCSCSLT